ncbi:hypothetical protein [Kitasatospora sp. NPDC088783]|uniref:hypothetical protein n=1 Tax=Kitasatospora sp. NPDC088783 TaxID=3364077 RepID=UPI0037FC69DE
MPAPDTPNRHTSRPAPAAPPDHTPTASRGNAGTAATAGPGELPAHLGESTGTGPAGPARQRPPANPTAPGDELPQAVNLAAILVQAAQTDSPTVLAAAIHETCERGLAPLVLATLLARLHNTAPLALRHRDGRPDVWRLTRSPALDAVHDPAALALLDLALGQFVVSARQPVAVLTSGLRAHPEITPAAIALATHLAAADLPGALEMTVATDGFLQSPHTAALVLPPAPGTDDTGDPADTDWQQPHPSKAVRWRNRLLAQLRARPTPAAAEPLLRALALYPAVRSATDMAQIVLGQEQDRLEHGWPWHVNEAVTRHGTARRGHARPLPLTWERVPRGRGYGFMTFHKPIGTTTGGRPVAGVTWGPWQGCTRPLRDPEPMPETAFLGTGVWVQRHPHPDPEHARRYFAGEAAIADGQGSEQRVGLLTRSERDYVWITFWAATNDPATPLERAGELAVPVGITLPPPQPGSRHAWLRAVLAVWDLITDPAPPPETLAALVRERDVELPDNTAKSKGARRRRSPGRSERVNVVGHYITPPDKPAPPPAPGTRPAPRAPLQYGYEVHTTGRRNHCFKPADHASYLDAGQECPHHREIDVAQEYRVRKDLDLRPPSTVRHVR